jgi:hypothetical protein
MQSKFTKSADVHHKITLESSIVYSSWLVGAAGIDCDVPFEVITVFVGEGTQIRIEGKTEKGKSLGKSSGVIYGNKFKSKLPIPDKVNRGEMVYFEVRLPQLGLRNESNQIPAVPPLKVTNMKWDRAEARRGDIVKMIADIAEVDDGTEVKVIIFEYDNDGSHDKIIEIPATVKNNKIELLWEYEYHEDTDEIPTQAELQKYGKNYNPPEYFFVIELDGQRAGENQESKLLFFKDWIEIELSDEDGNPMRHENYIITLPDGIQRQGRLDAKGKVVEKNIPPGNVLIEFPNVEQIANQTE